MSLEERFWAKVRKTDGCWEWTGARVGGRYGYIYTGPGPRGPHTEYAHRVSYGLAKGPIPEGLFVCHHCDNPPCVNPDHLYVGTAKDNSRDQVARGRSNSGQRGVGHWCVRLTERDVARMRLLHLAGVRRPVLARLFDVTPDTARDVCGRRTWRHIA